MTEDEFWRSTLAKVVALYNVKRLDWDKSRDWFLAQIATFQANRYLRSEKTDRIWNPGDFLGIVYPNEGRTKGESSVTVTSKHDPDAGAAGDWRALKAGLKGMGQGKQERKKGLKPFKGKR